MSDLDRNLYNVICEYLNSTDWDKIGEERAWNIERVTEHTGYSKKYLYNLINAGRLKYHKKHGMVYIPYPEVKKLIIQSKKIA
ncbi:hypothetical protein [Flexistipes sp.]|uniref:hypothetical protein n=1 Tax=Flexistipes sp. TaxID=3088135 RepID=UPI002E1CBEAA|nr:hypothetical protein [Flexistipes sp.]